MEKENILELRKVTKTFGDLVAVDSVDFTLQAGEIHAILGENGAGKSTLMNLIYGLYQPSAGRIYVTDREGWRRRLQAKSPRDAIVSGIGMVHQHFMLVENLTVAENIALSLGQLKGKQKDGMEGWKDGKMDAPQSSNLPRFLSSLPFPAFWFKREDAIRMTEELSEQFGLAVDPSALVRTLSVGLKQRVEILKALAVDARILILDEPTAVLSPQEVEGFFTILRKLQADGRAIIFISHKMKEVLNISDRITVLRRGKKVYLGPTGELTARELAREMIGEEINEVERSGDAPLENETSDSVLQLSYLTVRGSRDEIAVSDVSMATHRGEIVGIAGVDGNGQRELAEAIMGLRHSESGTISILDTDPKGTKAVRQHGVGYIPEDRQTTGVIASFSVTENLVLNVTHLKNIAHWNVLNQKRKRNTTEQLIADYDIRPPIGGIPAAALSGGNQQKIVLAREISLQPELLIAVNPTRGLDVNAARYVHENLLAQRNQSKSVLLISTELDEVLLLSDRLFVMSRGKLIEATAQRNDIAALGLLMTGETHKDFGDSLKT
ncbi:ABC transporter ATP-binding protein [Candidatus Poribacteria bacterium]|nr:ABC transporter ATP-binding protein [Candidatus Poribacteria bacterium]MYG07462.1 ABC transporter ATP-binding protein [Candidatus Poribacteria bacterium]MYK22531.1 ABC transporter ATP-binding protein [Candidatus Poribacteria bacterium]